MSNMIPEYSTKLFTEIWDNAEDFKQDYLDSGFPPAISFDASREAYAQSSMDILFYLLYARYGNNPIANYDENQFKYKLFSIIWQYGPTWEKRIEIQKTLRDLTEEELMAGAKQIYNHAFNPSSDPSTSSLEELNYINDQNTSNYKRGKLEAYGTLWEILKVDVTNEFLNKFLVCFKKFVRPSRTWLYTTEEDDDDPCGGC